MDERMDFREKIQHIERLLQKDEYTDSATRCVIVIEQTLRQVVSRYLDCVEENVREKVQAAVQKRDRSGEGIHRLTMGQVVHVIGESKFLEAVARALGKDLSSLQIIDLRKLTQLRNKFAHKGQEASRTEAEFLAHCLKIILETCDLIPPEVKKTYKNPVGTHTFDHGYALLVGVGQTAEPKWSLPVTVNDIRAIHAILTDPELCAYPNNENHVRLLCNADTTRNAILDGLDWLKTRAEADLDATVMVYYSRHGWLDSFTSQYYLIPHDVSPADIPHSALAAEDFTHALREIVARRLLVFVGSCHAEGMAMAKEQPESELPADFMKTALPKSVIDNLKQGEGRAVFTSSRGKQRSWVRPDKTMSVYTYHLIEALQGAGNRSGEAVVYVSNLMNHLSKTVPESARTQCQAEQTPFFDTAMEDFPVAMLRGGKGLPAEGWEVIQEKAAERIQYIVTVTGDGNVVGDDKVSQMIKADRGSSISGVTQSMQK